MKKLVIKLIKMYKKYISANTPPKCRFTPTCSEYAILAVEKYGVIIGLLKALWRILRCNPFSKGGSDPLK